MGVPCDRVVSFLLGSQCAYLLVPWQALIYGRFNFDLNENIVIWMGAPVLYLGTRAASKGRLRRGWAWLLVGALWLWLHFALVLNLDPHGFGPRNSLLFLVAGWIPGFTAVVLAGAWIWRRSQRRRASAPAATIGL